MGHVSYTELRNNLARYMDEAIDNRDAITITRQGGKGNVVMMSEDEFRSWQETIHLLASPANAARLLHSVAAAKADDATPRDLITPGAEPIR